MAAHCSRFLEVTVKAASITFYAAQLVRARSMLFGQAEPWTLAAADFNQVRNKIIQE